MKVTEVEFGSPGYEAALQLRKRILRDPLGLEWTAEEEAWEPRERHFVLLGEGGQLHACVVIRPLEEQAGAVKLRQMAVEPDCQSRGFGRALVECVEAQLIRDQVGRVELNARDTAVGFYEKLGYRKSGEEFVEVTIPHWKMVKDLAPDGL